jgi:hypothetical protein
MDDLFGNEGHSLSDSQHSSRGKGGPGKEWKLPVQDKGGTLQTW